jgi:DNA-directed RNA polymerase specialized sigma subunit
MTAKRPGAASPRYTARAEREQYTVYTIGRAYGLAVARMTPLIEKVARSLAQGDSQLYEDYVQEARIAIWEIDPSRFDESDERYLRRAVVMYMRLAARRERRETGKRRVRRDVIERALQAAAGEGPTQTREKGDKK